MTKESKYRIIINAIVGGLFSVVIRVLVDLGLGMPSQAFGIGLSLVLGAVILGALTFVFHRSRSL